MSDPDAEKSQCKVAGKVVPTFPAAALKDEVDAWAEELESCILLSKGGEAFGTENVRMEDMTSDEKRSNWMAQGLVMESLKHQKSLRCQVREQQAAEGSINHGMRALQLLRGCYRDELDEELTLRLQSLESLLAVHLHPATTTRAVEDWCEKIFELNKLLGADKYGPKQLAARMRGLVPAHLVAEEWMEACRELYRNGESDNPRALVLAIQTTFMRARSRKTLAGSRPSTSPEQTADQRLALLSGKRVIGAAAAANGPAREDYDCSCERAAEAAAPVYVMPGLEECYGCEAGAVFDLGSIEITALAALRPLLPVCATCKRRGHNAQPSAPGAKDGCFRNSANAIDQVRFAKLRPDVQKEVLADRAKHKRGEPLSEPPLPRQPPGSAAPPMRSASTAQAVQTCETHDSGSEDEGATCVAFGGMWAAGMAGYEGGAAADGDSVTSAMLREEQPSRDASPVRGRQETLLREDVQRQREAAARGTPSTLSFSRAVPFTPVRRVKPASDAERSERDGPAALAGDAPARPRVGFDQSLADARGWFTQQQAQSRANMKPEMSEFAPLPRVSQEYSPMEIPTVNANINYGRRRTDASATPDQPDDATVAAVLEAKLDALQGVCTLTHESVVRTAEIVQRMVVQGTLGLLLQTSPASECGAPPAAGLTALKPTPAGYHRPCRSAPVPSSPSLSPPTASHMSSEGTEEMGMEAEAARECGRQQPVDLEVASLRQQLAESEAARNETCVQLERYKDGRTAADEEHLQAACQDAVVRITAEHHEVEQLRLKALVEEHAAGTYRAVAGKALRGMGAAGGRGRGKSHAAAAARFGSFSMLADEDSGSEEGSEYEVKPAAAATDGDIIACDAQEMCSVSHFAGGGTEARFQGSRPRLQPASTSVSRAASIRRSQLRMPHRRHCLTRRATTHATTHASTADTRRRLTTTHATTHARRQSDKRRRLTIHATTHASTADTRRRLTVRPHPPTHASTADRRRRL